MIRAATSFILLLLTAPMGNETVAINSGTVDLGTFDCRDINRSTVVQRVCYDPAQRTLIVGVGGSYDRFCDMSLETFNSFVTAPSMGQFFNQKIRKSPSDGRYECRTKPTVRQSVSIAPTSASATTVPSTLASP